MGLSDGVRDPVQASLSQGDPFLVTIIYLFVLLQPVNKDEETSEQVAWEPEEII